MTRCLRVLADQSFHTYRHPLEVLENHPETAHAIIDYRDLVADPAATLEGVYKKLGFSISPAFRAVLRAEGERAREHVSGHVYSLAEFDLDADDIRARLADLFERYGWNGSDGAAPADRGDV